MIGYDIKTNFFFFNMKLKGDGSIQQKNVAQVMKSKSSYTHFDFVVSLGDHFYWQVSQ